MSTFTAAEKLTAIRRELKLRRSAYPRWVDAGKMTPHQAAHEIAVMEAIEQDYLIDVEMAERQGRLL
jgi:hypothetical protein